MAKSRNAPNSSGANVHSIITPDDVQALRRAYRQLEHPSLAAKLTSVVGTPIEIALKLLPGRWSNALNGYADKAISKVDVRSEPEPVGRDCPLCGNPLVYREGRYNCGAIAQALEDEPRQKVLIELRKGQGG